MALSPAAAQRQALMCRVLLDIPAALARFNSKVGGRGNKGNGMRGRGARKSTLRSNDDH